MSARTVTHIVALLQVFVGLAMLVVGLVALWYGDGDARAFFLAGTVTFLVGWLVFLVTRTEEEPTAREGFAIVTMAWGATALFGSLPYILAGVVASPMAAFFEAMSGFTTTGATVFADIEELPRGILLWRSTTHWLGGMGIIVLVIAILPFLGVGGMQLFRAEVPGPTPERLRPRITQTAKLLWLVYFGLTAAVLGAYLLGGMTPFDALNHAFSTIATGGFSTQDRSMAEMSPYIQWVTILFMYLAGVNYTLHFKAATGSPVYWKDAEWRFFTAVLLIAALIVTIAHLLADGSAGTLTEFRDALFQVVAITTTTGYVSSDYELWAPAAKVVILILFLIGGMAGSTSGGIKSLRVMLLLKHTGNELRRHIHPKAVFVTRIGTRPVKEEVTARVVGFVILYLLLCLAGALALAATGVDLFTAVTGSMASVGNIGPAFAELGPTDNFGWLSDAGLAVMAFLMLVGRLEIYTVLLLFHPELWGRRRSSTSSTR